MVEENHQLKLSDQTLGGGNRTLEHLRATTSNLRLDLGVPQEHVSPLIGRSGIPRCNCGLSLVAAAPKKSLDEPQLALIQRLPFQVLPSTPYA